jgi:hypothetical protein
VIRVKLLEFTMYSNFMLSVVVEKELVLSRAKELGKLTAGVLPFRRVGVHEIVLIEVNVREVVDFLVHRVLEVDCVLVVRVVQPFSLWPVGFARASLEWWSFSWSSFCFHLLVRVVLGHELVLYMSASPGVFIDAGGGRTGGSRCGGSAGR